jgi:hypothetical protein
MRSGRRVHDAHMTRFRVPQDALIARDERRPEQSGCGDQYPVHGIAVERTG